MGFFNLFGKESNLPKIKDYVWKNKDGKYNGCLDYINRYPDAVLICWFPETQRNCREFFTSKGKNIEIKLARTVNSFTVDNKTVIFLEHYPLRSQEEALMQMWNVKEVFVFSSLDEPFFEAFGSNRIISLMEAMGMDEKEHIEHSMISKSIKSAQEKLQEKVRMEYQANSAQEWYRTNIG